jgi:hypothetical protein
MSLIPSKPAAVPPALLIGLKEIGQRIAKSLWDNNKGSIADHMRNKTAQRIAKFSRKAKGPYGGKIKKWSPELEEAYQELSDREAWDDLSAKELRALDVLTFKRAKLHEEA